MISVSHQSASASRFQIVLLSLVPLGLLVCALGCTSTSSGPPEVQDGAFARVAYDRDRDESDATLRQLEEPASEQSLSQVLQHDFYLPSRMLSAAREKAEAVRIKLKNTSSADRGSLRILAIEALVNEQPELVEAYLFSSRPSRKMSPPTVEDQLLLGLAAAIAGDRIKARTLLMEAGADSTTAVLAKANLGLLALKYGSTLEALEYFSQAESIEPKNLKLSHLVGEAAYKARKYGVAREAYNRVIRQNSHDLRAQFNLGLVYLYGTRNFAAARKQFRIVVDHPKASRELRAQAEGAYAVVKGEEDGVYGLASSANP